MLLFFWLCGGFFSSPRSSSTVALGTTLRWAGDADSAPRPRSALCPPGESAPSSAESSTGAVLAQLSKMEISLTLTGKPLLEASSEESDARSLLLR